MTLAEIEEEVARLLRECHESRTGNIDVPGRDVPIDSYHAGPVLEYVLHLLQQREKWRE